MTVSIVQTANPAGVAASSTVATYTSVSIGTASPDRIIAVCVGTELASSTPSLCTIDTGSGPHTMHPADTGNFGAMFARIFTAAVPFGTSATIAVTYSSVSPGSTANHIAVYAVTGADAVVSGKGNNGSTDMDATAPLTTGAITVPSGGGFLAIAAGATDTVGKTWANASEDIDDDVGTFRFTTATAGAGSATITCTGGTNGEDGALSWVYFSPASNKPFITTLAEIGLTTGLELCLDAGDSDSYDPSIQVDKWLDVSGKGYDFYRGSSSVGDAKEPTFNGTAGGLSAAEFWSFDGGDCFNYDSANETWMENQHKANAQFSWFFWIYFAALAVDQRIVATFSSFTTGIGVNFWIRGSDQLLDFRCQNNAASVDGELSDLGALSTSVWYGIGFSVDDVNDTFNWVQIPPNQSYVESGFDYSSPSSSSAEHVMCIGAHGSTGSGSFLSNGSRMVGAVAWSRALSLDELFAFGVSSAHRFYPGQGVRNRRNAGQGRSMWHRDRAGLVVPNRRLVVPDKRAA